VLAEEKGKKGVRKYLPSRVDIDSSDGTGTSLTVGTGFWLCGQVLTSGPLSWLVVAFLS